MWLLWKTLKEYPKSKRNASFMEASELDPALLPKVHSEEDLVSSTERRLRKAEELVLKVKDYLFLNLGPTTGNRQLAKVGFAPNVAKAATSKQEKRDDKMALLQNLSDIAKQEQIANVLFVYDRRQIARFKQTKSNSQVVHPITIPNEVSKEIIVKRAKSVHESLIVERKSSSKDYEMLSLELKLVEHLIEAEEFQKSSNMLASIIKDSFNTMNAIQIAVNAAKLNLVYYVVKLMRLTDGFERQYQSLHEELTKLLSNVEQDIQQMSLLPIPQSLWSVFLFDPIQRDKNEDGESAATTKKKHRLSLADIVRIDKSLIDECHRADKAMNNKLDLLKKQANKVRNEVFSNKILDSHYPKLEEAFDSHLKIMKTQSNLLEELREKNQSVHKSINGEYELNKSEIEEAAHVAESNLLPKIHACNENLHKIGEKFLAAKEMLSSLCLHILFVISQSQSDIQMLSNRSYTWRENLNRVESLHDQLGRIKRMPKAFAASLSEIVRRRSFDELYTAEMERITEELGRMREEEIEKRSFFKREYGSILPKGVFPFLESIEIPHFEILKRSTNSNLPNISLDEVYQVYRFLEGVDDIEESTSKSSLQKSGTLLLESSPHISSTVTENTLKRIKAENEALKAEIMRLKGEKQI